MLRIENIKKIIDRKVMGGWVVRNINQHPTQEKYMFDIHCLSPIGVVMDRCTISVNRRGTMNLCNKTNKMRATYFFNYNGNGTNICGSADWLADMNNFVGQLALIITEYHNKK